MRSPFEATNWRTGGTMTTKRSRQGPLYRCHACGNVALRIKEKPPIEARCRNCGASGPGHEFVGFALWEPNGDITPLDAQAERALDALPLQEPADSGETDA